MNDEQPATAPLLRSSFIVPPSSFPFCLPTGPAAGITGGMKPTLFTLALLATSFFVSATSFAADPPAAGDTAKPAAAALPPGEAGAKAALDKTPRHGEWVDIEVPGAKTKLKSYVVYPERKDKAPVVIVIHEIFGLSDWVRSVADQLAADGFIAIAPDLLSGHGPDGGGTDSLGGRDSVTKAVRELKA